MIKAVLLALAISLVASQVTYSYSYSNLATSTVTTPSYILGTLNAGDIIKITIQTPSGVYPTGATLTMMDSLNVAIATQPAWTGTIAATIWTVPTTGTYRIQVSGNAAGALVMYYLNVLQNDIQIVNIVDVVRSKVYKYFYIPPFASSTVTVTISSGTAILYASNSNLNLGSSVPLGTGSNTVSLPSNGFIILEVNPVVLALVTISYPSSTYSCPFSAGHTDINSVFAGCTSGNTQYTIGLPCTSNGASGACLKCLPGYTLTAGKCLVNTQCAARQYFHFGKCFDVSPSCGNFDGFTGSCQTCADATLSPINGVCSQATNVSCVNGTHNFQGTCISDNCTAIHSNGSCSACVSKAFQLNADGTCTLINCGTGNYFSLSLGSCTAIPTSCSHFDVVKAVCTGCITTYFLNNGNCVQPASSANCHIWDFTINICQLCNSFYTWNGAICVVQTTTPTNPTNPTCTSNQVLISGACVDLPANCRALNAQRQCADCNSGYKLVAGVCEKCPGNSCITCPPGFVLSSRGKCIRVNSNCATVDNTNGQCKSCNGGAVPVAGLCCLSGQIVQMGVCIAAGGALSISSPEFRKYYRFCKLYSVPSRVCTQCLNGHTFDYSDHCA